MALVVMCPALASAQGGEWPTLSGAGIEYLSRSGSFQVSLSGQLDLETMLVAEDRWAGLVGGTSADTASSDWRTACAECHIADNIRPRGKGGHVSAHRLRVFADVFLGDHVYSLVEVRSDRGSAPTNGRTQVRVEQAFLRLVTGGGRLGAQAGRFASPFGAYPLRHLTVVDPFLRPPLPYDYRTVMNWSHAPPDATELLAWKQWPMFFRFPGVPPVWNVPYQWGGMLFGRLGPVDLRVAAVNSAPSSEPIAWGFDWERLEHPSWVVGARVKPSASLELGASYNRGPWMEEIRVGTIEPLPGAPPGSLPPTYWDFDQEIVSVDFTYARGPVMARGEAMLDLWEVPNVADRPQERLYTVELQTDLTAGLFASARFGFVDFRPLDLGTGDPPEDWDDDVHRLEASLGYRLVRNGGVLVSAYRQG
ncbi:MAG TPA: hypothetical protein VM198_01685, partial [Longimicrobiales bacterium]|nr:hypothetical protein [Longimicrobiales bacterium]